MQAEEGDEGQEEQRGEGGIDDVVLAAEHHDVGQTGGQVEIPAAVEQALRLIHPVGRVGDAERMDPEGELEGPEREQRREEERASHQQIAPAEHRPADGGL